MFAITIAHNSDIKEYQPKLGLFFIAPVGSSCLNFPDMQGHKNPSKTTGSHELCEACYFPLSFVRKGQEKHSGHSCGYHSVRGLVRFLLFVLPHCLNLAEYAGLC